MDYPRSPHPLLSPQHRQFADLLSPDTCDSPDQHQHRLHFKRYDSLDIESSRLPNSDQSQHGHVPPVYSTAAFFSLVFQSFGVVYGDLGTSPLYVYSSTFLHGVPDRDDVVGALSLIIYTLTLIALIKYIFIVLKANDNGNGGTFALYSLICRHTRVSKLPGHLPEEESVSNYDLPTPTRKLARASKIKEVLERSSFGKQALLLLTLVGTCSLVGDGILTPAVSVVSAVDGLQGKVDGMDSGRVALISMAILVALFSVQFCGTDRVGFLFAPCVLVWFAFIGGIGIYNVVKHDSSVYRAFSPYYIYRYFQKNKKEGWVSLGGIMLCITGTETMFADLGHFSVASIQFAFTTIVYPSLLVSYIGQAAYLMKYPEDVAHTFYKSTPDAVYWPMFVVAMAAALIASQAMISATFSIVDQSQALGCFPRVKIIHTSAKFAGQVYIPEVNWILMVMCLIVIGYFKTATEIGKTYGVAVVGVMLVTTSLVTLIMLTIFRTPLYRVGAFAIIFFFIELVYFSSNLYDFHHGEYIPAGFAVILLLIMYVWHYVNIRKYEFEEQNKITIEEIVNKDQELEVMRVPGIGLLYTQLVQGIPPIYSHFIENLPAMHAVLVLVTVKRLPVTRVPENERFVVRRLGRIGQGMYRCVARYGYMEGTSAESRGEASCGNEDFEEALMKSLENLIRGEEESGSGREAVNGEVIQEVTEGYEGEVWTGCWDAATEIGFLHLSRASGVTYLFGQAIVQASPDSSFLNKFVINWLYDFLYRACRKTTFALSIPRKRLLEVGMVYQI